ncbi:hypothetical protein [Acinetobacter baumannii]|uniref:hypothetical protein n=1 Tax=Acinetobacter baumannii TaxID=470 RepID=UPI000DE65FD6|nr:hypothetical protein [Acinetobacter baumannii]MBJ9483496.1 hypothetical protein [Acinetobacter baumannii]MBJ9579143.1 hypothetical protein [Acinetobacter baumannii]MBJ9911977.1 hypothetical protein [Acinetobacter baumannii]MBJ9946446.1 hypothetical protein [Acinetobacter baumannii]MCT9365418.1 hypothetical protein [Acinetobacter baumannii]
MKTSKFKVTSGALVIGILGSASWSILYDHVFPACTRFFIGLSSRFSNIVFVNISSHDLNSINQSTNFLITFLIVVAALFLCGWSYFKMQSAKEHFEYAESKYLKKNDKYLEKENEYSHEDFLKSIEELNKGFKKIYLFNMILLPATLIGFVLINVGSALTNKFINESISYFDYLLFVNAENLDDKTERMYKSEFSQIRSSQDYNKLIVELEKLAISNKLSFAPNSSIRSKEDLVKDHPGSKLLPVK